MTAKWHLALFPEVIRFSLGSMVEDGNKLVASQCFCCLSCYCLLLLCCYFLCNMYGWLAFTSHLGILRYRSPRIVSVCIQTICRSSMVLYDVFGCPNYSNISAQKKLTNKNFFHILRIFVDQCECTKTLSANRGRLWLALFKRANFNPWYRNVRERRTHFANCELNVAKTLKPRIANWESFQFVEMPPELFNDTNLDWALSWHFGYGCKHVSSYHNECSEKVQQ